MKVAFYRARFGNWRDWIVAAWTLGPYSHTELVFSDGIAFSASSREKGTRFKRINFIPKRWKFIEIETDKEEEIRQWCREHAGLPYDWLGTLGCSLGTRMNQRRAWFCSEICIVALKRHGVIRLPRVVSPNTFHRKLKWQLSS